MVPIRLFTELFTCAGHGNMVFDPLAARPMLIVVFVQVKVLPAGTLANTVGVNVAPGQAEIFVSAAIVATGLTLATAVIA